MKFGFRTPNIKKSIKARTTGKIKRAAKKSLNPIYGKNGIGFIKNPGKSTKNSLYHRTTTSITKNIKTNIEKSNTYITKSVRKINNGKNTSAIKDFSNYRGFL